MSSFDVTNATQRWRIDLAYDGRGLHGFAEQPGHQTVIGLLRETLTRTLRLLAPPQIIGAGRTDAGVHAFAQVIHVDLPPRLFPDDRGEPTERLIRSLNMQLAGRVRILKVQPVSKEFHARYSAQWRAYRYLVVESEGPALDVTAHLAWVTHGPIDVDLLNQAAELIVGTHDFRSFCRRAPGTELSDPLKRNVSEARWRRVPDELGIHPSGAPVLRLDIRANAFCHQMVRSLTALMIGIGQGKLPISLLSERFESGDRDGLPTPAPAGGLALIGVGYDEFAGGPSGFVG